MADKRRERYDIVSQAEKVLSDYIKKYLSLEMIEKREKQKRRKKFFSAIVCVAVFVSFAGLIINMLFFSA